ncbi:MAG: tRNA (adenosine(37)-N6)-threonylcarbamoyltransferase complex dimerization subunit type 1 TsaB [Saprospiraceae bacterium]|nr:tRNA (adenosine(37)-N6)-threonylcarbamoyltransferase complex dimerization subunit type 1 TsaB [Saprospiraceae bacterium]
MEPRILHIETSERSCSVCLSEGNNCISQIVDESGEHQSTLAPNIKKLLIDNELFFNDLDAFSVNVGPGSYTSLRVGVMMAKGLSVLNRKPLIANTGLLALAMESKSRFPDYAYYIPLIDARRDDVYFAVYDEVFNELKAAQFAQLSSAWFKNLGIQAAQCLISGSGSRKWTGIIPEYPVQSLEGILTAKWLIKPALQAFQMGIFESPAELKPFYIKDPNITVAKKKI